jgi:protein-tyrosine-phosphatase
MNNTQNRLNVLFLCTGNSARSILFERLLNHLDDQRFQAFSAGSQPAGCVNPFALQVLDKAGISTQGLRSKSWDEFTQPNAPQMDLIITVCDHAAGETCPYWPGQPATAHWGYPDPAAVQGSDTEKLAAFEQTLRAIKQRLDIFLSLPVDKLDKMSLQKEARSLAQ